jgi:dihydroflavonol-4-reductase
VATVLVTGATGFIGAHLTRALVARGDEVRVAVRASSRRDALAGLPVREITADVTDRRAMRHALRGVERLFHVAGTTNLRMPADEVFRLNALGARQPVPWRLAGLAARAAEEAGGLVRRP